MLRYTKKNYFKICGFVYGALVIFGGCSDSATQEESKIEDDLTWTTGELGESEDENLSLAAQGSNSVDFGVLRVLSFTPPYLRFSGIKDISASVKVLGRSCTLQTYRSLSLETRFPRERPESLYLNNGVSLCKLSVLGIKDIIDDRSTRNERDTEAQSTNIYSNIAFSVNSVTKTANIKYTLEKRFFINDVVGQFSVGFHENLKYGLGFQSLSSVDPQNDVFSDIYRDSRVQTSLGEFVSSASMDRRGFDRSDWTVDTRGGYVFNKFGIPLPVKETTVKDILILKKITNALLIESILFYPEISTKADAKLEVNLRGFNIALIAKIEAKESGSSQFINCAAPQLSPLEVAAKVSNVWSAERCFVPRLPANVKSGKVDDFLTLRITMKSGSVIETHATNHDFAESQQQFLRFESNTGFSFIPNVSNDPSIVTKVGINRCYPSDTLILAGGVTYSDSIDSFQPYGLLTPHYFKDDSTMRKREDNSKISNFFKVASCVVKGESQQGDLILSTKGDKVVYRRRIPAPDLGAVNGTGGPTNQVPLASEAKEGIFGQYRGVQLGREPVSQIVSFKGLTDSDLAKYWMTNQKKFTLRGVPANYPPSIFVASHAAPYSYLQENGNIWAGPREKDIDLFYIPAAELGMQRRRLGPYQDAWTMNTCEQTCKSSGYIYDPRYNTKESCSGYHDKIYRAPKGYNNQNVTVFEVRNSNTGLGCSRSIRRGNGNGMNSWLEEYFVVNWEPYRSAEITAPLQSDNADPRVRICPCRGKNN